MNRHPLAFVQFSLLHVGYIIKSGISFSQFSSNTISHPTQQMYASRQGHFGDTSTHFPQQAFRIIIDQKYLLKRLVHKHPMFNIYEAIDFKASRFATVYIKPGSVDFYFSKKIKEELRNKVSPSLIWSGIHKIQKNSYNVEVHQKYGPSLKSMFDYVKEPISQRDFLLVLYQLLRLVEKYATMGYVYRQLDMHHVVFDSKPQKNQVYLLNVFSLKKKGEQQRILNTRFCSKGAHLGLKSCIKDDLESICYILINIHMQGTFLKNTPCEQYAQAKANLNLSCFKRPLPPLFLDFYSYIIGLNYNDEVNYFKWRNIIYRNIGKEALLNPYEWMIAKSQQNDISTSGTLAFNQSSCDLVEIQDEIKHEDRALIEKLKNLEVVKNEKR